GDLIAGVAFADLDLARLEAWMMLGDVNQIGRTARQIDERHGAYWSRRVEQVLTESRWGDTRWNNADLLSRRANGFAVVGKLEEALDDYDGAAKLVREAKKSDAAFELGFKAALVEQRLKPPADPASRLRALATAWPKHAHAPEAHLLAAWNTKGTADEETILREHLATWSAGDSAAQAHLWLAQLAEAGGKWPEALDHYAAVSGSSPSYGQANARLAELA